MSSTRNLPCTEVDVVETASVKWREVLHHSVRDTAVSRTRVSNIYVVRIGQTSMSRS